MATRSLRHDQIFGYQELLPEWSYEMSLEHVLPEDRERVDQAFRHTFEMHEPWDFECRIRRIDDEVRWIHAQGYLYDGYTGASARLLGLVEDITERKRAEESLRDADRRKDEFLATLAHELRNPLAPIRTGLELMRMSGDDRALVDDVRATMERQIRHLVRLVDDLLDVSRITRGKIIFRKERVELAPTVQSAVEVTRALIEGVGHELTVTLPPQPIFLEADPTRLAQIFSNLLINAARYTPEGGRIRLTAEIGSQGAEVGSGPRSPFPEVRVTVSDTGIGIPADMLERIFEMFAQAKQSQDPSQGLGIGLTLVKSLAEMHGGIVGVHSDGPNRGSAFRVRLPALDESSAQRPQAPQSNQSAKALPLRRRVLVVDDNQAAAEMLSRVVTMLGNEVRTAYDGLQALEAAEAFRPDVVLLDLGMPRFNGYDTARYIREQPWGERMVLVALTGWGQEEDKRRTKEAGFDHHLIKPAEPAALKRLLADLGPKSP